MKAAPTPLPVFDPSKRMTSLSDGDRGEDPVRAAVGFDWQ